MSLLDQSPKDAKGDALMNYWATRLLGGAPTAATQKALTTDAGLPGGVLYAVSSGRTNEIETALRRYVAVLSATDEFSYR
jgi:hypothetical protein